MVCGSLLLNVGTNSEAAQTDRPDAKPAADDLTPWQNPSYTEGYFDSISSTGLCSGWAARSGVVVSIQVDGTEVGTVASSAARADVQAVTGEANTGWTFQIPASVSTATVHIVRAFVASTELKTSGKKYGGGTATPTFVSGNFDSCTADGVCSGWASQSGVVVSIQVDGVEVGTVASSAPRPDVQAATGQANTGWTFTLPASVNRNQAHTVRAFVGTRELAASGKSFGTNPGGGTPNFIDGVFDNCGLDGVCSGWAAQSGVVVSIQLDGTQIGTATASGSRPDVQAANGQANTGWTFTIPQTVDRTVVHTVRAFVGTRELKNSGKTYGGSGVVSGTGFQRFVADLSSDASIQRQFAHANVFYGTLPTVNNPTKWIDGLLEVPIVPGLNAGPGIGGTGCSWHWWIPQDTPPPDELWCEYDFLIDPDVPAGFNEEGCKLPGLAGAWEQPGQWAEASGSYGWFSARLWHRRPDGAGNCELAGYVYSARSMDAGNPFGEIIGTGKMLQPGVKYKLGQHIKLNSRNGNGSWNSDGIFEVLLDGVVVFSDTAFKMRADPRAVFQDFFVNIFHGGTVPPKAPIHYRIGGIIVDNKPITAGVSGGVIQQGAVPAWRRGLPIGQWVDIPNTSPAKTLTTIQPAIFDGDFSGLYNDRVNGVVYSAGAAGHAVSDQNGVYAINLMQDAPQWTTLRGPSGDRMQVACQSYWPDGRPTGAHLYYSGQVAIINGKPVLIRTVNSAGAYGSCAPYRTDAFHIDTNDWDLNGGDWDIPPARFFENAVAIDARTGRIYFQDQGGTTAMLDPITRKWTQGFTSNGWGYAWGGQCVDPVLDELLYDFGGYRAQGDFFEGLHLTRNVRITHPYTWAGTRVPSSGQYRALIVQERNRKLYCVGGQTDPAPFNRLDLNTWVMTNIGTVPQPVTVYNRIEDFPTLGGIAFFPAYGSNMRFYATE